MKKILFIICFSIVTCLGLFAQSQKNKVTLYNLQLEKKNDMVNLTLTADIGRKVVKSSYALVIIPQLVNGNNVKTLPSLVVRGRLAEISAKRNGEEQISGNIYSNADRRVEYKVAVPYEPWFEGATLKIERSIHGCCSESLPEYSLLVENISLQHQQLIENNNVPPIVTHFATVGDMVSRDHPFVIPINEYTSEFDKNKGLTIYFRLAKSVIDPFYRDNESRLKEVVAAIRTIEKSNDSRISRVVIGGFASPEGWLVTNNRLGNDRANAFKVFIVNNSSVGGNKIEIYNGGEDWAGLRKMVEESDLFDKHRVLDIIDNVPIWDEQSKQKRISMLKMLNGGATYEYMLKNYFPDLRNAAYIKVYYENINR